jgi:predicted RNA-binding Zn-ribbon protein involved in translation (DUF1610 family)
LIPRLKWHASVTDEAVLDACERQRTTLDNPGMCLACGVEADGVEPDAEEYECEACGEPQVFGCDLLLLEIA